MGDLSKRTQELHHAKNTQNVLYVMARDQRIHHNHCVNLGYEISHKLKTQLFLGIELDKIKRNERQSTFMIEGLKKLEKDAENYNLNLYVLDNLQEFCKENKVDCIILDFNPMREYLKRDEEVCEFAKKNQIKVLRVDAHNLVPCWLLDIYKRTPPSVRLQLNLKRDEFFADMPELEPHKFNKAQTVRNKYPAVKEGLFDHVGGFDTGMAMFDEFCEKRFKFYADERNDTEVDVLSNLSPWVTFGQISPQKIIYMIHNKFNGKDKKNLDVFISEFFIWRETAEHFVYHEKNYDNIDGALPWAKETLLKHKEDKREVIYKPSELENSKTKDDLWNTAQKEMKDTGKMHGYVRMYWCKTIAKWFNDPEDALAFAIEQNDKYSIDGNSCGGYLGCMWSICGSMDRAFAEREIVGKIRPMKPFKSPEYIKRFKSDK